MFNKIKVDNFKSFKSLTVDNLSQVNIFFGKNNCGKSTFLESVFMLSGMTNPEMLLRCNRLRGFSRISDFSFFFHNFNSDSTIELSGESEYEIFSRNMSMELSDNKNLNSADVYSDESISSNQVIRSKLKITAKTGAGEVLSPEFLLDVNEAGEQGQLKTPSSYKEMIYCAFLTPRNPGKIMHLLGEMIENKQEKFIVSALKKVDYKIKDFVLSNDSILVDTGLNRRMPIQLLGDGVRKFFDLALALYKCKNGVLLVDEIDNGLHFSVMKKLWSFLLRTAREFNVQVYATTHNIDSLIALSGILGEEDEFQKSVSWYKLIHCDDDTMKVLYYPYAGFSTLLENENEIR